MQIAARLAMMGGVKKIPYLDFVSAKIIFPLSVSDGDLIIVKMSFNEEALTRYTRVMGTGGSNGQFLQKTNTGKINNSSVFVNDTNIHELKALAGGSYFIDSANVGACTMNATSNPLVFGAYVYNNGTNMFSGRLYSILWKNSNDEIKMNLTPTNSPIVGLFDSVSGDTFENVFLGSRQGLIAYGEE